MAVRRLNYGKCINYQTHLEIDIYIIATHFDSFLNSSAAGTIRER